MAIAALDHAAIPTYDPERFLAFYRRLGFSFVREQEWRRGEAMSFALAIGPNRINVHASEEAFAHPLRGRTAEPGCGDFCFVWEGGIDSCVALLARERIEIAAGPVPQPAGRGLGASVYLFDPDGNLLEFVSYESEDVAAVAAG